MKAKTAKPKKVKSFKLTKPRKPRTVKGGGVKGKPKRKYADKTKAAALATLDVNGGNVMSTAAGLEIPRTTLEHWSNGLGIHPEEVTQLRKLKKGQLADALEDLSWMLAAAIPAKIDTAALSQVSVALGISIDKTRLLREQATSIGGKAELTDDELITRLRKLAERARREERILDGSPAIGFGNPAQEPGAVVEPLPELPSRNGLPQQS